MTTEDIDNNARKINKDATITWQAEEYVQREKNVGWYFGMIFVSLVLVAVSIIYQSYFFTALIVLSAIALILYSVRPPRKLSYTLDKTGLQEDNRMYKFEDYKSFGLLQDDTHFAIILTPNKRFSPAVTVYFPEAQGEEIVDMFGYHLPMAEVKLDVLDKIVKALRI